MKTIKIFRKNVPIRLVLFFFIGVLCGIYFFISFPLFGDKPIHNIIRVILVFFGIKYLIIYSLLLSLSDYLKRLSPRVFKIKQDESKEIKEEFNQGKVISQDILGYYFGAIAITILACILAVIGIIIVLGILLIKGILWLIQNPNPGGILVLALLIAFGLCYLFYKQDKKEWEELNDFFNNTNI